MQYDVNNGLLQVVIEGEEINAVVGEAAQIDVGEAINYIQTGTAEIEQAVQEGITQFNGNATEKTNEFDLNAQNKTSDFNSNATQKTLDFNSNASDKTNTFNQNAIDKTSDFNTNSSNKTIDFNDNYNAKIAVIEADVQLAKDWATKTDGTVDGTDYSAKYYAQSILPIASEITTVAGISSEVTTVAGISSDVTTVSGISVDVTAVKNNATNINTVAGDINRVNLVADDIASVHTVAVDISNVIDVADNKTNIDTVAGISSNVTTVAGIASDVSNVASNNTDISAVAADLTNIDAVSGNITNINAVNANKTNIDAVAGNETNINSVAGNATNINNVAADLTNINSVAADLTNIDNASTYAAEAKQWAVGDPSEPSGGSAKYWAGQAAAGQVQSDWTEADTSSKAYIKNKPTAGTGISLASNQISVDADASPTQYSVKPVQSGGVFTSVNNLQQQIDAIVSSSDVFDIVGTYAELQAYDITTVPVNDIIKVLVDSTHDNAATYYRCVESGGIKSWSYIGSEGAYYTKAETNTLLGAKQNTITGAATTITSNNLTASVALVSDANGKVAASSVTSTELSYLSGVSSAIQTQLGNKQATLVSGTNIKTINNTSLLGSGNISINPAPSIDNKSITKNSSDELQTVGVINSRDSSTAIKTWTGTKTQYDAILSKDANTLYNITDDTDVSLTILEALYPVGSIYITTANTCPLSALISGSTWELVSSGRVLQGADSGHSAGTTIEAGLPNITGTLATPYLRSTPASDYFSGAFVGGADVGACCSGGSGQNQKSTFDASRSSSIYGNSSTVQPPAYVVNIYRRTA